MERHIYKIIAVKVIQSYILEIVFSDGTKKMVNLEPVLYGEMYAPLRDKKLFSQVRLNREVHTIEWPNGADFDPATLFDWENSVEEISRRCKEVEMV